MAPSFSCSNFSALDTREDPPFQKVAPILGKELELGTLNSPHLTFTHSSILPPDSPLDSPNMADARADGTHTEGMGNSPMENQPNLGGQEG